MMAVFGSHGLLMDDHIQYTEGAIGMSTASRIFCMGYSGSFTVLVGFPFISDFHFFFP
ncbi:hypothetical protein BDV29DRAFT_176989 [Aspergillus leporis]|uniref:Uncharacterized protein n=1 Tax=Aspergillus leporis TaxID=41062 RepID=A0A5N5WVT2_9EURO|nr:hypothetical protein BDV29DRAFT_176989 [Aspergillus leporis]